MHQPPPLIVPALVRLANPHKGAALLCHHTTRELTAVCPETRSPDFYKLDIWYLPDDSLVELKSVRDHIAAFRDVEIYHEPLINTLFETFVATVRPTWVRMRLTTNPRGGVTSTYHRTAGPLPSGLQLPEEIS